MRHGHDATARPSGLAAIAAHTGIIAAHTGIIGAHTGISGAYVRRPMLVAFALAAVLMCVSTGSASAASGWWAIQSESSPTNLAGEHKGEVTLQVSDLGDAVIEGAGGNTITITDRLPAGITATAVGETVKNGAETSCSITANVVTCTFSGHVNPYEQLPINIDVKNELPAGHRCDARRGSACRRRWGGERSADAAVASQRLADAVRRRRSFELAPFNEDGTPATQAGSQPFQLTTSLVLNQEAQRDPAELPKNLTFNLPAGLLGNPSGGRTVPADGLRGAGRRNQSVSRELGGGRRDGGGARTGH